jgi:hypothetical protein
MWFSEMAKISSTASWIWVGVFAVAGSAPGWIGDAVWSVLAATLALCAGAGLGIASLFACRTCGTPVAGAAIGPITGAGLGVLAWVFSMAAWFALEISLGGRVSPTIEALAGAAVGAFAGRAAFWFGRTQTGIWLERCRLALLGMAMLVVVILATLFLWLTGPHDLRRYPSAASSPYRLPWVAGVTRVCCQGNRGIVSHRKWEEFAYDFAMPVGSDVRAARGGTAVKVDVEHDGNGFAAKNNFLVVDHGDGTFAWYFHLRQGGAYVEPGQRVRQGEPVAASGNVGSSLLPHLHFQVTDANHVLQPVTFADVNSDQGIPRMFKRYTSNNVFP